MTDFARTRIGRVRLKAGGELRLLHHDRKPGADRTMRAMRDMLEQPDDVAGYALVLWTEDGSSSAATWCGPDSQVLIPLLPDYARNRLMLVIACRWSLEDVCEAMDVTMIDPDDAS